MNEQKSALESVQTTQTTQPVAQPSPEAQPQPAKKAWSQPTMTVLEISATAFTAGASIDGSELANSAS